MTVMVLTLLFCVYAAAFFSGTEMAFISANKVRIRELAERGDSHARKVIRLQNHPQLFLTAILLGNNTVNVVATAVLAAGLELHYGITSEWVVTAAISPLLLIFGEMLPKDYCRLRSQSVLLKHANSLDWTVKLLSIPSKIMLKIIDVFMKPFGGLPRKSFFVSEEEFRSLIEESTRSGVLEKHEKQIIDTILDSENIRLDAVMTPIRKVPQIDIHGTIAEVKQIAAKSRAKMVVVYEEDPSIIVGLIYVFDILFEEKEDQGLKNFLRAPVFLHGNVSVETAFLTLQKKRASYAIITNPQEEAVGTVPIESLLVV